MNHYKEKATARKSALIKEAQPTVLVEAALAILFPSPALLHSRFVCDPVNARTCKLFAVSSKIVMLPAM